MSAVQSIVKDPTRGDRRDQCSTLVMPGTKSLVTISHDAPIELQLSMTLAVNKAWEAWDLRHYEYAYLRRNPEKYGYCPRCRCNKSGDGEPNAVTEACDDAKCLCHDEDVL